VNGTATSGAFLNDSLFKVQEMRVGVSMGDHRIHVASVFGTA
jgi:hypothetical protein